MAETHRRVEPRSIVGTGMATDPERLRDIEQRQARMERDHALPKRKFGEVITEAPKGTPKDTEWMNPPPGKQSRVARDKDPEKAAKKPEGDAAGEGEAKEGGEPAPAAEKAAQPAAAKDAAPPKGGRPTMGASSAAVGSKLGRGARVAFKV
ncbi:MAG: hypothetical protein HY904_06400 [Deltaproteobacteria bacterium]|nr:hypothetical protein [Deltaproteobacteria bacterium]